jgi:hypothetical protein
MVWQIHLGGLIFDRNLNRKSSREHHKTVESFVDILVLAKIVFSSVIGLVLDAYWRDF